MVRLVVDGFGKFIGQRENQIVVKNKNKIVDYFTVDKLDHVIICGSGAISFDAIKLLSTSGVDVTILDSLGNILGKFFPPEMKTVYTRRMQYKACETEKGCEIAKNIIVSKIKNQYAILGTLAKTRKLSNKSVSDVIMNSRGLLLDIVDEVLKLEGKLDNVRASILGLEGKAATIYWGLIGSLIPEEFGFKGRRARGATDLVNVMLNYGYGILLGEIWRAIYYAGLDPFGGFLHVDRPGKPSLVLDLMEAFRGQLVDKNILALIFKKEISFNDGILENDRLILPKKVRLKIIRKILSKLESYLRVNKAKIKWSDLILKEARKIVRFVRGEMADYKAFYLRW